MSLTEKQIAAIVLGPGKDWSDEQWQAITADVAPHLVVAGAGSGKTTIMAARILWLISQGHVEPGQILGLTFTNKAAREFDEKVQHSLARAGIARRSADDIGLATPVVSTYHSFAQNLLGSHGLRVGYEPGAELLNEVTRRQLAMRVASRTNREIRLLTEVIPSVATAIMAVDDLLAERLIEPAQLRQSALDELAESETATKRLKLWENIVLTCRERIEISELVAEFRRAKAEAFVADFADQMRMAAAVSARLAAEDPEAITELRQRFSAVLLDEYQDTSIAQRVMLQSLFGDGHPVMAVGDPCQAIYGWRGASAFNMDHFTHDFPHASGQLATSSDLTIVRRCAPEILSVANNVSADIRAAHPIVKELRSPDGAKNQGRFEVALHEHHAEETAWVVKQIQAATGSYPADHVALLCRTNADIARFAGALDEAGIAYQVSNLGGLLGRPEVADVRAMLQVMADPSANIAAMRVLTGPRWAFGVRDLAVLGSRASTLAGRRSSKDDATLDERLDEAVQGRDESDLASLMEVIDEVADDPNAFALSLSSAAVSRCAQLSAEVRHLRRYVGEPLHDLIRRVIAATGADVEVLMAPESMRAGKIAALDMLVESATEFISLDGDTSLMSFLRWLDDAESTSRSLPLPDPGTTEGAGVRIMTVHTAKGLEFDAVVLPSLVDGIFPSKKARPKWPTSYVGLPRNLAESRESEHIAAWYPDYRAGLDSKQETKYDEQMAAQQLLEERRLAYVAVTRARHLVVASGATWGPTQKTARMPSPWLRAMREHVLDGNPGTAEIWVEVPPKTKRDVAELTQIAQWPVSTEGNRRSTLAAAAEFLRTQAQSDQASVGDLTAAELDLLDRWDRDIALLAAESAPMTVRSVRLPSSITTTDVMRIAADRQAFAADLARPMPRVTSSAARRGTDFHAWVEQRWRDEAGTLPLVDDEEIDPTWLPDPEVQELIDAYERGPYAARRPHDVEVPFATVVDGVPVRGRIDAVFLREDGTWEVIDWKTSRHHDADDNQLRVYRQAWAEIAATNPAAVAAGFHYVRSGTTVFLSQDAGGPTGLVAGARPVNNPDDDDDGDGAASSPIDIRPFDDGGPASPSVGAAKPSASQ